MKFQTERKRDYRVFLVVYVVGSRVVLILRRSGNWVAFAGLCWGIGSGVDNVIGADVLVVKDADAVLFVECYLRTLERFVEY